LYDTVLDERAYYRKSFKGIEFFHDLAYAVSYVTDTCWFMRSELLKSKRGTHDEWCRTIRFYGLPRDVAVALSLYQEMVVTVHTLARLNCGKGSWTLSHNSYAQGLCNRLYYRGLAMKKATEEGQGSDDAGKAGAIVLSKTTLLDRYAWEKLKIRLSPAEKQEIELRSKQREAEEAERMKDPAYAEAKRKAAEKEAKRLSKLKGPRGRSVDWKAYQKGEADAENVSLGTNGIGGKPNARLE
jgi:hypothetical protein